MLGKSVGNRETIKIEKLKLKKNKLALRERRISQISSKHSLFWNGVDGLLQIQKKNSNFNVWHHKTSKAIIGIAPTDFKVCRERYHWGYSHG